MTSSVFDIVKPGDKLQRKSGSRQIVMVVDALQSHRMPHIIVRSSDGMEYPMNRHIVETYYEICGI